MSFFLHHLWYVQVLFVSSVLLQFLAFFRNLSSLSSNVILLWIHYENNSSANFELVYIGAMDNGSAGNPRS